MTGFIHSIVAAVLLMGAAHAADDPVINIYSWTDYIAPELLSEFEQEFGIRVNYDTYESSEIVDSKLLAGGTGYDVIIHSAQLVGRLLPIGLFEELDFSKIPNAHYIDPKIAALTNGYDPGNIHNIPYMWGSVGYAYNIDMIKARMPDAPIGSGDMVFKPEILSKFADCGVSFLDSPDDVLPMALAYLGHDINSVDPAHLDEVEALLKGVRPYIKYFSSTKMIQDLPNSEVCLSMSWSGDYAQAEQRGIEANLDIKLAYAVPETGGPLWLDVLVIPKDAPHTDNAHIFLNFIMRPENMARISNLTFYANGNLASKAFLNPEVINNPSVYPPDDIMSILKARAILNPKEQRLRTRLWTRFKTGMSK
jgi:putrescine transport system substrate-binding protein